LQADHFTDFFQSLIIAISDITQKEKIPINEDDIKKDCQHTGAEFVILKYATPTLKMS
jgi:hypothetical protein